MMLLRQLYTQLNAQTDRGEIGNMFIIHISSFAYLHPIYFHLICIHIYSSWYWKLSPGLGKIRKTWPRRAVLCQHCFARLEELDILFFFSHRQWQYNNNANITRRFGQQSAFVSGEKKI